MSLTIQLRKAAYAFPIVFALAANANAAPIAVGDCGPADVIKTQLAEEGFVNYFVYGVKLFNTQKNSASMTLQSVYSANNMTKGLHVGRRGENGEQLCVLASISDIIIGDNIDQSKEKTLDSRFLKNQPQSETKGGLNRALRSTAENVGEYPVLQARMTDKNGNQGYFTIINNPTTHTGGEVYSDLSGSVVASNFLFKAGEGSMPGFTPAGKEALAQIKLLNSNRRHASLDATPKLSLR